VLCSISDRLKDDACATLVLRDPNLPVLLTCAGTLLFESQPKARLVLCAPFAKCKEGKCNSLPGSIRFLLTSIAHVLRRQRPGKRVGAVAGLLPTDVIPVVGDGARDMRAHFVVAAKVKEVCVRNLFQSHAIYATIVNAKPSRGTALLPKAKKPRSRVPRLRDSLNAFHNPLSGACVWALCFPVSRLCLSP